jgi:hypothetical protein
VAIREGKWRCPYCSAVNRGAELSCGGCGATRAEDVEFFLEDQAEEVTDAKLLALAQAGADWLCESCQTSNRPEMGRCRNCGAERGTSPSRPVRDIRPERPAPPAPPPSRGGCLRWVVALALLALGFCAVASYFAFRKTEETVRVTGFEWTRAIDVEAWRAVRNQAWEGETPAGARVLSRERQVHHAEREQSGTERVKVGKRDLGNGFFEDVYEDRPVYRERPVYGTRVTYELETWVKDRTERASGSDRSPRWPDPGLRGREREAGRHETYVVLLEGRRRYRMELPQERWAALPPGQELRAVVQGGGRVLSLE